MMKALGDAIEKWGRANGTNVVKVDMFLNHRIDTGLLFEMGKELARHFVQNGQMAQAKVFSFTHKTENVIRVDERYLPVKSRVLIVDDFLADGQAVHGMMEICRQLDCVICGVGIGVEKGFQDGGKHLREQGVDLCSLAIVDSIENGKITLRE